MQKVHDEQNIRIFDEEPSVLLNDSFASGYSDGAGQHCRDAVFIYSWDTVLIMDFCILNFFKHCINMLCIAIIETLCLELMSPPHPSPGFREGTISPPPPCSPFFLFLTSSLYLNDIVFLSLCGIRLSLCPAPPVSAWTHLCSFPTPSISAVFELCHPSCPCLPGPLCPPFMRKGHVPILWG